MKIGMRGTTHDGEPFDQVREFEYTFELFTILREAGEWARDFEIWLTPDVDTAEAELAMGLALGAEWQNGVCKSDAGSLTRLTGSGGRA